MKYRLNDNARDYLHYASLKAKCMRIYRLKYAHMGNVEFETIRDLIEAGKKGELFKVSHVGRHTINKLDTILKNDGFESCLPVATPRGIPKPFCPYCGGKLSLQNSKCPKSSHSGILPE